MAKQCTCGVRLALHNVFVLDCKHILCQDCSRIWAAEIPCPRCHIETTLDLLSISDVNGMNEGIINRLTRFFCIKVKELSAEKQDALLSKKFPSTLLEELPATHGDIIRRNSLIDCSTVMSATRTPSNDEHKRKRKEESGTPLDNNDDEQPLDTRKRRKAADYENDCPVDNAIMQCLLKKVDELKLQVKKTHHNLETQGRTYTERLSILKRRCEVAEQKAKKNSDMAREVKTQSDKIEELQADARANDQHDKLLAAKKVIQQLKSKAECDKLALRKAERRAAEYEAWGRKTKTYYQDIIKQMEVNQPKSDYLAPASPYAREYLQELPSLRVVHPDRELGDNDSKNLFAHGTDEVANISSDAHGGLLVPQQRSSTSREVTRSEQASFNT